MGNYGELRPEDFPPGEPVLKWKNGYWYRDNDCGYTDRVLEAGLYEQSKALPYCFYSRDANGPRLKNGSCGVFAVPIRMALAHYTVKDVQDKIIKLKHMLKYVPNAEEPTT